MDHNEHIAMIASTLALCDQNNPDLDCADRNYTLLSWLGISDDSEADERVEYDRARQSLSYETWKFGSYEVTLRTSSNFKGIWTSVSVYSPEGQFNPDKALPNVTYGDPYEQGTHHVVELDSSIQLETLRLLMEDVNVKLPIIT